jgi:cytochrome d ubiquinol oxidase subunit II
VAFIASLLVAGAISLYPTLIYSTISPALSLTIANTAASYTSLSSGLAVIGVALLITTIYQAWLIRQFTGKVREEDMHY